MSAPKNNRSTSVEVAADNLTIKTCEQVYWHHPDSIAIISLVNGRVLLANPAFCTCFGLELSTVVGRSLADLQIWQQQPEYDRLIGQLVSQPALDDLVLGYKTAAGYSGDVLIALRRMELEGQPCVLLSAREVSARLQQTRLLQEQSDLLSHVINTMGQGLTITNEDRQFEFVNPAYARLFGYSQEDLIGKTPREVTSTGALDSLEMAYGQRNQGLISTYESTLLRRDGSVAPVLVTGSPRMKGDKVVGTVAVITDMTEIRQAEAALARHAASLHKLEAAVLNISSPRPLAHLSTLILERAADLLQANSSAYYSLNDAQRTLECVTSYKTVRDFAGTYISFGDGVAGKVAQTGKALVVDDYSSWPGRAKIYDHEQVFSAVMGAPMHLQGVVVGVLEVMRDAGAPRFDPEDMDILNLFANHAAVALGNAHLLVTLEQELLERKRADAALRESELRLREVLENSLDASYKRDLRTNAYEYLSPVFERISGMPAEELLLMPLAEVVELMHPDDLAEVQRVVGAAIAGLPGATYQVEYRFMHRQGGYRWFHDRFTVLRSPEGQPLALIGSFGDVTQRRQAEEALRLAHARLETIIEGTQIGTWDWTVPTGEVVFNEIWANLLGYTLEELQPVGINTWIERVHPDDLRQSNQLLKRHFKGKLDYYDCECRMVHKDGHLVWVHDRGRVYERSSDGKPLRMSGTHMDITARRQAEDALRAAHAGLEQRVEERTAELLSANARLEKALNTRNEFLAMMSHELRTPLTGIIGLAQSLQYFIYGNMNERQIQAMQNIELSGRRLHQIIDTILDYTRLQSDPASVHRVYISLTTICKLSVQSMHVLFDQKNQSVVVEVPRETIFVRGDEQRLHQVITSLLENANKFTSEGGRIKLLLTPDVEGRVVRVCVSDTGIGISSEDLPRLFQPFQQLDSRLSRKYNGIGMGLALSRLLVELHDGSIEVQSAPGQGSSFTVTLPWVGV
jgi:PAS domain S-box-containing protein